MRTPDHGAAERPQGEQRDPKRRHAERNRDDQDKADQRGEHVQDGQPHAREHEPDEVEDQSNGNRSLASHGVDDLDRSARQGS
jgi:hypothetical protein